MQPQTVRLFVPFRADAPWIVRREVARVGTYPSHAEAVAGALAMRAKLARAWNFSHPPVRVQEGDGSWREIDDGDVTSSAETI